MILLGASNFPVTRSNFAMHFRKCENFRERERERERREKRETMEMYIFLRRISFLFRREQSK